MWPAGGSNIHSLNSAMSKASVRKFYSFYSFAYCSLIGPVNSLPINWTWFSAHKGLPGFGSLSQFVKEKISGSETKVKSFRPVGSLNCVRWNYNTRDDSTHGHHQMVNTKIRLIMLFAAENGEALHSEQKQDLELTVAQTIRFSWQNSSLTKESRENH